MAIHSQEAGHRSISTSLQATPLVQTRRAARAPGPRTKPLQLPTTPSVTFFEIVAAPPGLVRSRSADSCSLTKRPNVVAIIEDTVSACQALGSPFLGDDEPSLSSAGSDSALSTGSLPPYSPSFADTFDHLDGTLLPEFFAYTSAEREFIRQYQPVIIQNGLSSVTLHSDKRSDSACFWVV